MGEMFYNIKLKLVFEVFFLIIPTLLFSQSQVVKAFGGTNYDEAECIIQTSDGGYAVAGYTSSFGTGYDFLVAKFNSSWTLEWTKNIGGTGFEEASSIIETFDGGYAIAGWTESFGAGISDVLLVKLDANGNFLWARTLGGTGSDEAYSLIEIPTGGADLVIAGRTQSPSPGNWTAFVAQFTAIGNFQWASLCSGTGDETARSVICTSDGGYAITGETSSSGAGNHDMFIEKIDAAGSFSWATTLGGTGDEYAYSVVQTADGGYVIGGRTTSATTYNDIVIAKFNSTGGLVWQSFPLGEAATDDEAYDLIQTTDGGFAVAGRTESYGAGNWDVLIVKYYSFGSFQWASTVGGASIDIAYTLSQTTDGGYVIAGQTLNWGAGFYDYLLAKFDANGGCCLGSQVTPTLNAFSLAENSWTPSFNTWSPTVTSQTPTIQDAGAVLTNVCEFTAVEMSSFIASPSKKDILLSWLMESGFTIAQFILMRRKEKGEYKVLTGIPGSGTTPLPKTYSYTDKDVKPGITYFYKLGVVKTDGNTKWYGPVSAVVRGTRPFLSISPNPFTQKTVIRYSSIVNSKDSHLKPCSLRIYDTCGRLVKRFTIHDSRFTDVIWDGKDNNNRLLPSGMYFCILKTGKYKVAQKILLVRLKVKSFVF